MAWRLPARNRVCAGAWDNLWLRIGTRAQPVEDTGSTVAKSERGNSTARGSGVVACGRGRGEGARPVSEANAAREKIIRKFGAKPLPGMLKQLAGEMATMANFKPSPCLQTARVATSCDACGVEVGSEALRCHLVEERASNRALLPFLLLYMPKG